MSCLYEEICPKELDEKKTITFIIYYYLQLVCSAVKSNNPREHTDDIIWLKIFFLIR